MDARKIEGFDHETFTREGPGVQRTHDLYRSRSRSGPPVIVLHEIPGLHPGVIKFGECLVRAGFTVYMPSLFGQPGEPPGIVPMLRAAVQICVAREFYVLANRTSPITPWLRALAVKASAECDGRAVGVVGMCFTGGFALAMAVEPTIVASVLSQPSLPFAMNDRKRAELGLDDDDLKQLKTRARKRDLRVLGLRFRCDYLSPRERLATLSREFGEAFEGIDIDSSPGNPHGIGHRAHAVLTVHLVDKPGHPTREARDRVIAFLKERLLR